MANRRGYDIIWKKGSWFEKGGWILKPRKSASEKAGETIVIYLILGAILFLLLSIIILTLPIWSVLIGLQMLREKRYIAGIVSVCALVYFFIDVNNQWLTSFIFTGYYNSEGHFASGLLSVQSMQYLLNINLLFTGLGVGYILDSFLISKYGKKFEDNRITAPQFFIYAATIFLAFIFVFFIEKLNFFDTKVNSNNSESDFHTKNTTKPDVQEKVGEIIYDIKRNENNYISENANPTFKLQILKTQVYHSKEITDEIAKSSSWLGLFMNNEKEYYIDSATVQYKKVPNPIDETENDIEIYTVNSDSNIILFNQIKGFSKRSRVVNANIQEYIEPNSVVALQYLGKEYSLEAKGWLGEGGHDMDYTLTLTSVINGQKISQLLVSYSHVNETHIKIIFGGDIDNDGILDLIIDTSNHYNVTQPTLYLSSLKNGGDSLLGIAGLMRSLGNS